MSEHVTHRLNVGAHTTRSCPDKNTYTLGTAPVRAGVLGVDGMSLAGFVGVVSADVDVDVDVDVAAAVAVAVTAGFKNVRSSAHRTFSYHQK